MSEGLLAGNGERFTEAGNSAEHFFRTLRREKQRALEARKHRASANNSSKQERRKTMLRNNCITTILAVALVAMAMCIFAQPAQAASISGTKFHDENGNSVWDGGEIPMDNVTIRLHGVEDGGPVIDLSTLTNAQGEYSFTGLLAGDYYVYEDVESWWAAQTYPLTVFHTILDVLSGDNLTGYDFGNDTLCEQTTTYTTCLHGTDDNFNGPEPSYQSPGLIAYLSQQYDYIDNFDEPANNQHFGHTFNGCWDDDCVVVAATLRMKVRATGGGAPSDWMYFGDFSQGSALGRTYSISMNELEAYTGGDGTWNNGDEMTVTLDMKNLPPRGWFPTNQLSVLQNGELDIVFQDETSVDFIEMTVELCCQPSCYADGDADGNGIALAVADLAYLDDFITGCGPPPVPLYSCDLNGDGVVDPADLQLYNDYFVYGISVFGPYGGYPVLCPCNPTAAPVPDTVNIFGLDHTSWDWACLTAVDDTLTVTRLNPGGRDGVSVDLLDTYYRWDCIAENVDPGNSAPLGASLQIAANGVIDGEPNQAIGTMLQTKVGDSTWQLAVGSEATSYTLEAFLDDSLVYSQTEFTGQVLRLDNSRHFILLAIIILVAALSDHHTAGDSTEYHEDGTSTYHSWEAGYTWNERTIANIEGGPSGIEVDEIRLTTNNLPFNFTALSNISIHTQDIDSIIILSESATLNYGGIAVSNLGNAILTPVDTTLVVSNITSTGNDGSIIKEIDAEADNKDGEWSLCKIVIENPDLSGWPIGASLGVEYFFPADTGDAFSMESFFEYAGSNTWNLAVQSDSSIYTVEAFNDSVSVFSVVDTGTTDLGYIVETAKGVYPVGFSGASTGKPASIVASSDYDFTPHPDGVQWTCAALGVDNLTIDYLSVSTEVFDTSIVGISHASMLGDNGAKSVDPISFTILSITAEPASCCQGTRGNVDGDPNDEVNVADLTYLVDYLFRGGGPPPCPEEGDVNGDGDVNVADLTYLVDYLFRGGPPPPDCGSAKNPPAAKTRGDISLNTSYEDGSTIISLESPVDLRGVQIELSGEQTGEPTKLVDDNLELFFHQKDDGEARVGILDLQGATLIQKGSHPLVRIPGKYEIVEALVSDLNHNAVVPAINVTSKNANLPTEFALSQNYPNPFNPTTEISFSLPNAADVKLEIYNIMGQQVATIVDGFMEAGTHSVIWDSKNDKGHSVSSGVYFYRLEAGSFTETKKMMLLK